MNIIYFWAARDAPHGVNFTNLLCVFISRVNEFSKLYVFWSIIGFNRTNNTNLLYFRSINVDFILSYLFIFVIYLLFTVTDYCFDDIYLLNVWSVELLAWRYECRIFLLMLGERSFKLCSFVYANAGSTNTWNTNKQWGNYRLDFRQLIFYLFSV